MAPADAASQDYPSRQINDLVGRYLGDGLGRLWGQSVVIENRGGAGTAIGAVIRSQPDGYTLLFVSSSYTSNAAMQQGKLPFDPIKDLLAVGMAAYGDRFIIIGLRVPLASSLQDIQRKAKTQRILFGTS